MSFTATFFLLMATFFFFFQDKGYFIESIREGIKVKYKGNDSNKRGMRNMTELVRVR